MANTGSENTQAKQSSSGDMGFFHLENNDQPGISIVTAPFTGTNYLTWSTSIQISLGAKDKLVFIDGSIEKSEEVSSDFFEMAQS